MFLNESVGEYVDKRANEYGIFRKEGGLATGEVLFTGLEGTTIPKGTLVGTVTQLLFETVEEAIIPVEDTSIKAQVIAVEMGSKYNVGKQMITQIPVVVTGINAVTNEEPIKGGTDPENDEELVNRVLLQLQNPATSGNAMHYKLWALEVDGVGDAKIFPLHDGPGTVKVLPISRDKKSPDDVVIRNVKKHIEEVRPIGASVEVTKPVEHAINVQARIKIDPSTTLDQVKQKYLELLKQYLMESVFKLYVVDYFKCLSLFYDIEGVKQVIEFKVNNGTTNITIESMEIQVIGEVEVSEGGI